MNDKDLLMMFEATKARIKQIEEKAFRRLSWTDEEIEKYRSREMSPDEIKEQLEKMKNDPAFKDLFASLSKIDELSKSVCGQNKRLDPDIIL